MAYYFTRDQSNSLSQNFKYYLYAPQSLQYVELPMFLVLHFLHIHPPSYVFLTVELEETYGVLVFLTGSFSYFGAIVSNNLFILSVLYLII